MTDDPVIELIIPGHFLSERKRQVRMGKFAARVDMADRVEFKAKVAVFAAQVAPPELLDEPLRLEIIWQSVKPKSYRKHEDWPHKKPDLDNLVKILLDPLTGILFRDDAQICEHHLVKRFGPTEQITVRIWRLCSEWPY